VIIKDPAGVAGGSGFVVVVGGSGRGRGRREGGDRHTLRTVKKMTCEK
jgi:hypothetical protein